MRVAVFCLAYSGKMSGIDLLASYFAAIGADLYIHVDLKSDIRPYDAIKERHRNVHLLKHRVAYFWGGFNGVKAVTGGLLTASSLHSYDRYIYITEDTAPLLSTGDLLELFSLDCEFLLAQPALEPWVQYRYREFFYYDCSQLNPRVTREAEKAITDDFLHEIARLAALREQGKVAIETLYHGPAYFALTARAVKEILRSYRTEVALRTSFEFSAIPEEQYFHTILGNSPAKYQFREAIVMDMTGHPAPAIYEEAAPLVAMQSRGVPFVRKVVPDAPAIADFVRGLIDQPT